MTRTAITSILGSLCLVLCAAVQAQNAPASSTPSTPSSSSASEPPSSASDPSMSSSQPSAGKQDTSKGAKEQQSQKKKCPKNGDTSNVNCKETGKSAPHEQ